MSLNNPYSMNDPYSALLRFVQFQLEDLGIDVERIGEFLIVNITSDNLNLFEAPVEGLYILKFQKIAIPREITDKYKKTHQIHLTNYHPLIKKLSKNISKVAIQSAEYKHENELDYSFFFKWFTDPLERIGLSVKNDKNIDILTELEAIEVWYEISTNAGRGIFPVVLKRMQSNSGEKEEKRFKKEAKWTWDETFQKKHKKRRGELTSIDKIITEDNEKNIDFNLDLAVKLSFDKVKEKLEHNKLKNGAFLRRLRQLRIEEIHLKNAQRQNESADIVNHYIRRITHLKQEILAKNDITLNTFILLYSAIEIEMNLKFLDDKNQERFLIRCSWSTRSPQDFLVNYDNLNKKQMFLLKSGRVDIESPSFGICPLCDKVQFAETIKKIQIGKGHDCLYCRITCHVCNFSVSPDKRTKHSLIEQDAWLCPEHTALCEISGSIVTPDEAVTVNSGETVLHKFAVECGICKETKSENRGAWWLQRDSKLHSYQKNFWLCQAHTGICEISGLIVSVSEITPLETGKKVAIQLTGECTVCTEENQKFSRWFKRDMVTHSFKPEFKLCPKHTAICELSKSFISPTEIVKLKSGELVAIQITDECFVCKMQNHEFVRSLSEEMKTHGYDQSRKICKEHTATCEISGLIVSISEIINLKTGEKVAIQLTDECHVCKVENREFRRYLTKEMSTHSFDQKKKLCPEHTAVCDISRNIVTPKELVKVVSGLNVLPKFAEKCISCSDFPVRNPLFLKTGLFSHEDNDFSDIYACREHSFKCWRCNEIRPIFGKANATEFHYDLCPSCKKIWDASLLPEIITSNECIICEKFIGNSSLSSKFDKCPICKNPNIRQDKPILHDKIESQLIKKIKFFKIYYSSPPHYQYSVTLVIWKTWYNPWKKKWILFNKKYIPIATNQPKMLKKSIEIISQDFFFELNGNKNKNK